MPLGDWLTVQQCALQCGVPRYDAEVHAGHLQQGNIEHIFGDFWRTSFSALEDRVAAVAAEVGLHLSISSLHPVSTKYRYIYRYKDDHFYSRKNWPSIQVCFLGAPPALPFISS